MLLFKCISDNNVGDFNVCRCHRCRSAHPFHAALSRGRVLLNPLPFDHHDRQMLHGLGCHRQQSKRRDPDRLEDNSMIIECVQPELLAIVSLPRYCVCVLNYLLNSLETLLLDLHHAQLERISARIKVAVTNFFKYLCFSKGLIFFFFERLS